MGVIREIRERLTALLTQSMPHQGQGFGGIFMEKSAMRQCVQWLKNIGFREFPGDPVVRTWCFHCRGPDSTPGRGTRIPQAVQYDLNKKQTKKPHSL